MLRMIEIRLVDRASLTFEYRTGVGMPKISKRVGVEGNARPVFPIEPHGDLCSVDEFNSPGVAIVDGKGLVGAGKLNSVAGCKFMAAILSSDAR
jgi:hypothetical protein